MAKLQSLQIGALTVVSILYLGIASHAQAHAKLIKADPSANAILSGSPKIIQLQFSEELERKFSHIAVTHDGAKIALKEIPADDKTTLAATPESILDPGSYELEWIAVAADDGHKMQGRYVFKVK